MHETLQRESRAASGKPRDAAQNLIDAECADSCLFRLILLVAVDLTLDMTTKIEYNYK